MIPLHSKECVNPTRKRLASACCLAGGSVPSELMWYLRMVLLWAQIIHTYVPLRVAEVKERFPRARVGVPLLGETAGNSTAAHSRLPPPFVFYCTTAASSRHRLLV